MLKFLKNIYRIFMNRAFLLAVLVLAQFGFLIYLAVKLYQIGLYIYVVFNILSVIASLFILNRSFNPAYKLSWIILILAVPIAGYIFYLLFGSLRLSSSIKRKLKEQDEKIKEASINFPSNVEVSEIEKKKLFKYINYNTSLNAWENTSSKFLQTGEAFHFELIHELQKASKYIFMEYFIIREGQMWDSIEKVLIAKVEEGLDVRLIYDDFGTINKVSYKFKRNLEKAGIKVVNFNPFRPRVTRLSNYRDHRKITVIDGNVGFVGGSNLADEYINVVKRFGYWKDVTVVIKGSAVFNLTSMFLSMWEYSTKDAFNYLDYKPTKLPESDGLVLPFGDGPLDNEQTIEMSYINIINNAKKYVYITTPYLVLDNEMTVALRTAAQSGVDVRIMMPHIPDKKTVFMISRSYYTDLIKAGVKIYEFTPGFLHSKYIISDDEVSIVGTANLDYRSFYLHYEVVLLLYKTSSLREIKEDFDKSLGVSHLVELKEMKKQSLLKRALVSFLRVFSPMI